MPSTHTHTHTPLVIQHMLLQLSPLNFYSIGIQLQPCSETWNTLLQKMQLYLALLFRGRFLCSQSVMDASKECEI